MIYVVATLQLKPQSRDHVLREIEAVSAEVRREDGCLEYCATVDIGSGHARQIPLRADVITVIERWRDVPALQAHSAAPHMQAFRQRIGDAIVSTTLQVLSPA
ncbi:MAG: antibiotic biosynthesis monooxygenase [Gammaproteobacteria bacterium]|nr:antibiotic biosynthesis monooxygenase [Gammaproteobacteria bacterium]